MLSATMDELVIAANIASSQHVFCAIRSFGITHRPEQPEERVIARCIVDAESTSEDLVVVQYDRSTQEERSADHVINFRVAEIVAEWHLDIMLQVKNTIHSERDRVASSIAEPEPEPEQQIEPEPEPDTELVGETQTGLDD